MNSNYKIFYIILLILSVCNPINAQSSAPINATANTLMKFENIPVELSTGLPNVAVPLFTLPTVSKDVNINFTLQYHPLSVAVKDSVPGNLGRGWSMMYGGTIVGDQKDTPYNWQETPNSYQHEDMAYYNYNFLGKSGMFYVAKDTISNKLYAVVGDRKNGHNIVNVGYDETTFIINSFTIFDDNGFSYIFSTSNTYVNVTNTAAIKSSPVIVRANQSYVFHLTTIKDANGLTIANYYYKNYNVFEEYHEGNEKNTVQEPYQVVTNHGKVQFNGNILDNTPYNHADFKFTDIIVYDFKNNPIRRFDFSYDPFMKVLSRLDESDILKTDVQSHFFYYRDGNYRITRNVVIGEDRWGYPSRTNLDCIIDPLEILYVTNPDFVTHGVLEKMVLPSGGAYVYQYEANTYSVEYGIPLDATFNRFEVFTPENLHNYQSTVFRTESFGASKNSTTFTLTSTQRLFFKFEVVPFTTEIMDENGNYAVLYPTFSLKDNRGEEIARFSNDGVGFGGTFNYGNGLNNCFGWTFGNLQAGTYTLEKTCASCTAEVLIHKPELINNPKQWYYGPGIRIKKIGYFEEGTVNQRYYDLPPSATISPVKETSYDYNLVENSNRSSGATRSEVLYQNNRTFISYRNVKVTESGGNGWTTSYFYSPIDDYPAAFDAPKYVSFGKEREVRVYSQTGQLKYQTNYFYTPYVTLASGELSKMLSTSMLKELRSKSFSSDNSYIEKVKEYSYDTFKYLTSEKEYINGEDDFLEVNYTYNSSNVVGSKNRKVVEKIEKFRKSELLSTAKINFNNSWTTLSIPNPVPNISYLTSSTQISKGTQPLVDNMRYTLYDGHSNLWESEKPNGTKTVYIWGYNHTQIVAQIENSSFNSIPNTLVQNIITASNTGTEASLIAAQNALRNHSALAGKFITTYTYKPLIGVSTVTDSRKQTTTYLYDIHNRLAQVKDHQGNIITENKYNYRNQN